MERVSVAIFSITLCALIIAVSFSLQDISRQILNNSRINTDCPLIFYSDSGKTNELTEIQWGSLYPNEIKNYTFYMWNDHSRDAYNLSMTTGSPTPLDLWSYSVFSWNREYFVIEPKTLASAIFTLNIFPNITNINAFSFNITISGF